MRLGRTGRALACAATGPPPATLREDIRSAITAAANAAPGTQPTRHHRKPLTIAAATTALAATAIFLAHPWRPTASDAHDEPPSTVIAAAVAGYRDNQLPGSANPSAAAPDLSAAHLHLTGAADGELSGTPVTAYAYDDPAGRRVTLYLSRRPFPEAADAHELAGAEPAWTSRSGTITILCGRGTHTLLVLSEDPALVTQTATALGIA